MTDYKCVLCGASDWKNVDEFRFKPQGMAMCNSCAFVTYPEKCSKIADVHKHYQHGEYRNAPTVDNLFSSERKLHYHVAFLEKTLNQYKDKEFKVLEIGAALGLFLNFIKNQYPKSEVYGTELTESFVRVAWHLYKIRLDQDFDDTKKYDIISCFKVAEHMPDVDKQLERYRSCLAPGGYLYISVPTWFHRLNDFGSTGYHIENYYDPNHVNVWSTKQFEYLLRKCGFKIVEENHKFYDDTYLCQVAEKSDEVYKEDPAIRLDQLKRILKASEAWEQARYEDAKAEWPNFPMAQINSYEQNRNKAHALGFDELYDTYLKTAWDACGNTHFILNHIADICMRYEKFDKAIEISNIWLDNHPMDTQALMNIHHCLRSKALYATNDKIRDKMLMQANGVLSIVEKHSLQRRYEAITWIMQNFALVKVPHEGEPNLDMTESESNESTNPS